MQPNHWLRQAIAEFKAAYSENELRIQYDKARKADSGLVWEDFLWDKALLYQLDLHPELKTKVDDMPFKQHAKDILKANYLDAMVMLVQMTLSELRSIPGLSQDELQDIVIFLNTMGLSLEEGEEPTLKQAWEECFSERKEILGVLRSLREARKAIKEDKSLSYNKMIEEEVHLLEDADVRLITRGADKGTKQRFLWEYAIFLNEHISCCPKEAEGALSIAKRELELKEYLYGVDHKLTGESLELVGNIYQEQLDYPGAVPYYIRAIAIAKREEGPNSLHVADLYHALGLCFLEQKDYDASLAAFCSAYEGYTKQPEGPDRKTLGHLCFLIADAYREQGDLNLFNEYVDKGKEFQE